MDGSVATQRHAISVVVPVYQGERTLEPLVAELEPLTTPFTTSGGHEAVVSEVLLVHDCGPDESAAVMRRLAERHPFVRTVWLSRNFGQHPATLAGMASSGGDWIVTMDEDGQHDPAAIAAMLDTALDQRADVVYARPTNSPPHGAVRNAASRFSKRLIRASAGDQLTTDFHSFRLVLGEIGRSVAAYAGPGVYLDVAMSWVTRAVAVSPIPMREEADRPSGYSLRSLVSHFWRMVVTSGTRALRSVSLLGVLFAVGGGLLAVVVVIAKLAGALEGAQGWASLMVAVLVVGGTILFALGVVAEYIGVSVDMAMGKPLYLIVNDPADGPLGRRGRRSPGGAQDRDGSPPALQPVPSRAVTDDPLTARAGKPVGDR